MAQVEGVISPELAKLLESKRDELNRLYRQRAAPSTQVRAGDFLRSFGALAEAAAGPILGDARLRASAGNVVRGVFLAVLDLSGRGRLGAGGGWLERGLAVLLASFPGPVAQDPERFVRSAAAAMEAAAGKSEETLSRWLALMAGCGGMVTGMEDFLNSGLAAAWLAGLPQYRQSALRALSGLPRQAVSQLLGLDSREADPVNAVKALSLDPWYDPALTRKVGPPPQAYLTAAGGWRGYGGQFQAPPTLKLADGEVLAVDGQSACRLFADRWGTFLLDEPGADTTRTEKTRSAELVLNKDGFSYRGENIARQEIMPLSRVGLPRGGGEGPAASCLLKDNTIYFTLALSFRVFIIGRPGQDRG